MFATNPLWIKSIVNPIHTTSMMNKVVLTLLSRSLALPGTCKPQKDRYFPIHPTATETIDIPSKEKGVAIEGSLYMPNSNFVGKPALLIMAHGLGGRKYMGITTQAAQFAASGNYAALAFDYRCSKLVMTCFCCTYL